MVSRLHWAIYGTSVAVHLGLAIALERVDPRPAAIPVPITITVRELPSEPPTPPPAPAPEPELETPPEPAEAPPVAKAPPEAAKPEPAPRPRAARPTAAAAPAPVAPAPSFGMQGGTTGTAVPAGDPGGAPGGDRDAPPRRVVQRARVLESTAPPPAAGCTEAATKPRPLSLPQPEYTDAARAAGIAGKVRVEVSVDARGVVTSAKVIGSLDAGLDAAAVASIEQARFEPATQCGKPIAATFKISVKFAL